MGDVKGQQKGKLEQVGGKTYMEKKTYLKVFVIAMISAFLTGMAQEPVSAGKANSGQAKIPGTTTYADKKVVDAFTTLEFEIIYDKELDYAGVFSIQHHAIILKKQNRNWLLHEMGHFLSRLKDGADSTKKFKDIYRKERQSYRDIKGQNVRKYVCKNNKEYFAQSFADYTIRPKTLKKQRPGTYTYIARKVDSISKADIERIKEMYGRAWGMQLAEEGGRYENQDN